MAWRKTSPDSLMKQFRGPLLAGVVAIVIAAAATPIVDFSGFGEPGLRAKLDALRSPAGLACFGLCGFTAWTVIQEFHRGIAVRRKARPQPRFEAGGTLLDRYLTTPSFR